jgi:uncharacterized cupin superfamily protein
VSGAADTIVHIGQAGAFASNTLEDWGQVGEPVGAVVPALRGRESRESPEIGVWESSPGRFRRQVKGAEFMHFVAGWARFHSDTGQTVEIRAGDAVYFPANTSGTWEVIETLRKTYAIW